MIPTLSSSVLSISISDNMATHQTPSIFVSASPRTATTIQTENQLLREQFALLTQMYDQDLVSLLDSAGIPLVEQLTILKTCREASFFSEHLLEKSQDDLEYDLDLTKNNAQLIYQHCQTLKRLPSTDRSPLQSPRPAPIVKPPTTINSTKLDKNDIHRVVVDLQLDKPAEYEEDYGPGSSPMTEFMRATGKIESRSTIFNSSKYFPEVGPVQQGKHQAFREHGIHALFINSNGRKLVPTNGQHPLVYATHRAFQDHEPLTLDPTTIASVVVAGFAHHINQNSERLRDAFVDHADKKTLKVRDDSLRIYSIHNNWLPVFDRFGEQIQENIGIDNAQLFSSDYTTSTPVDMAASRITLMSGMQNYFEYRLQTRCGISHVIVEGSTEDWQLLKSRVHSYLKIDPELTWWITPLSNLLDTFIETSMGNPELEFWRSWSKYQEGSGGASISGYINALFPYLIDRGNTYKNHYVNWNRSKYSGAGSDQFPCALSTAPVIWEYMGHELNINFNAGLMGVIYTGRSGGFKAVSGFAITDDDMPTSC